MGFSLHRPFLYSLLHWLFLLSLGHCTKKPGKKNGINKGKEKRVNILMRIHVALDQLDV